LNRLELRLNIRQTHIFHCSVRLKIVHMGITVACGYSSQYNIPPGQQFGIRTTSQVIGKRLIWRGISVFDDGLGDTYRTEHQENVGRWLSEGSLEVVLSETRGIDNAPDGLIELFAGRNVGKALLSIGEL
jgi:Putative NADP-dependent oxidoreductases